MIASDAALEIIDSTLNQATLTFVPVTRRQSAGTDVDPQEVEQQ